MFIKGNLGFLKFLQIITPCIKGNWRKTRSCLPSLWFAHWFRTRTINTNTTKKTAAANSTTAIFSTILGISRKYTWKRVEKYVKDESKWSVSFSHYRSQPSTFVAVFFFKYYIKKKKKEEEEDEKIVIKHWTRCICAHFFFITAYRLWDFFGYHTGRGCCCCCCCCCCSERYTSSLLCLMGHHFSLPVGPIIGISSRLKLS